MQPVRERASWLFPKVDWVIVGGESGPKARPCNLDWIRSIVAQCKAAGVRCFVKQWGSYLANLYDLKDKKGGDDSELPLEFGVREMPA